MAIDDPVAYRQRAEQAWETHAEQGRAPDLREEVVASWDRSAAHLERDRREAPLIDEDRAAERWRHSPLRSAVQSLTDDLVQVVGEGAFVAAVTGADGTILWTHGSSWMRDRAAEVHFMPAGRWDEASMGTNALALALQTNRAAEVFSAEHFSSAVHEWVCYSAPINDRESGRLMGVLDLSTTWDRAHPLGLSMASALARNLSLLVPAGAGLSDEAGLALRTLGATRVTMDGRVMSLPRRQVEILTVLSLRPDGLTLEALHAALFPDGRVKPATVKAEISHLRRALGEVVGSRPYRLLVPVAGDHLEVDAHVRAGRLGPAVEAFAGPMLPESDAPLIREHAVYLEEAVRRAVLASRDPDLLFALGGRLPWDATLHEQTIALLPETDPRSAIAHARAAAART